VPPGDATALAAALTDLLLSADRRDAAAAAGIARAADFAGPSVAARYAEVYATVAG
jgi:hypothetical protein